MDLLDFALKVDNELDLKKLSGRYHDTDLESIKKEAKEKISKNNPKYWATHKMSSEHKKRIGEGSMGNHYRLGIKHTEESKQKMSEAHKGVKLSPEHRRAIADAQRGEKGHFWRGGISDKNKLARNTIEHELWREDIFARDNWTCQECGERGCTLNAHHIKPFSEYPELRVAIDNGITLCEECHKKIHNLNTK